MKKCRVGVLVSGFGSNLQALLDNCEKPDYPAEIVVVISNKPEAFALERARKGGVPAVTIQQKDYKEREAFDQELIRRLEEKKVDLVALAGFMRVLSPTFIKHFHGRILNIHPALLPAFPGTEAIREAWEYGVKVTGVTVHFVDEGIDTGPVILQEAIDIKSGENLENLEKKIHQIEHRLYPRAIQLFAEGRLTFQGRKVVIQEGS